MSFQPGANLYSVGFGNVPAGVAYPHIAERAPTTNDVGFAIGQRWIDTASGSEYFLGGYSTSLGVTSANWGFNGSTSGDLNSLTTDDATVVTPTAGTIIFTGVSPLATTGSNGPGTASIALTGVVTVPNGGTGAATLTNHGVLLGSGTSAIAALAVGATGTVLAGVSGANPAFTGSPSVSGSLTAATTITATLGNITATNGNVVLGTAGNKLVIATGSNASVGVSGSMSGSPGSIVVATTASSATAKIFYSRATAGGTLGNVSISAQDGTGFTLLSTGNETSTFNWWIINA